MTTAPTSTNHEATLPGRRELRAVHPSSEVLRRLQAVVGSPLVTIMLPTFPAGRMTHADRARLDGLVRAARDRVDAERDTEAAAREALHAELERVARSLGGGPTGDGLAVFVGGGVVEAYRLPTPPEARVVVDPTFATRDLAEAIWSQPSARLLALAGDRARLFVDGPLPTKEVVDGVFPMRATPTDDDDRRGHRHLPDPRQQSKVRAERFLRTVEVELRRHHTGHLPLVVFAVRPTVAQFGAITRQHVVGSVHGNRMTTSGRELAELARPMIRAYLAEQRTNALAELDRAESAWRTTRGVAETWEAASRRTVATLLVDRSFRWPGKLTPVGDLAPAVDPAEPGVIDDVVDDLIEMVALDSGEVHFLESGQLGRLGVAAILRR